MSSFSSVPMTTAPASLDPSKHVNFSLGMVLGVDDFNQEFFYLSNRDQWLARDLIGYGTVCGLDVSVEDEADKGPSVRVDSGAALNPRGQFIRVTPAQCAYLNAWLNTEKVAKAVQDKLSGGKLTIYLNLCYRDCLTDSVPVPGEPCRTEDASDLLRPSRVKDDFSLDFSFDAPDQTEEDSLRAMVAWMRLIPVAATGATLNKFLDAIRAGAEDPAGFFAKPPATTLAIPEDRLAAYLREAFMLWTTELRGNVRGGDADCVTPSTEDCVLLAEISFKATGSESDGWAVNGAVTLDETRRPYLLHLRMLQEWLLTAGAGGPVPSDNVVTETTFGQPANAGKSEEYSRADHTHGTPPDPIPAHQADPKAHALAGDVTGFVGDSYIQALQKIPVKAETPVNGQVLGFVRDHWEPIAPPQSGVKGTFVTRPETAGTYGIVAAGICDFDVHKPFADMLTRYNGLAITNISQGRFGAEISFVFNDYSFDLLKNPYIVKLTPWINAERSGPFMAWVVGFDKEGFTVGIGTPFNLDLPLLGQLMIEVSTFQADGV
jgi:hypothetical protein